MSSKKYLDHDISKLKIDLKTIRMLEYNNINKICDLCILKRKDLKGIILLSDTQINSVIIALQLLGLDLNQKIYKEK